MGLFGDEKKKAAPESVDFSVSDAPVAPPAGTPTPQEVVETPLPLPPEVIRVLPGKFKTTEDIKKTQEKPVDVERSRAVVGGAVSTAVFGLTEPAIRAFRALGVSDETLKSYVSAMGKRPGWAAVGGLAAGAGPSMFGAASRLISAGGRTAVAVSKGGGLFSAAVRTAAKRGLLSPGALASGTAASALSLAEGEDVGPSILLGALGFGTQKIAEMTISGLRPIVKPITQKEIRQIADNPEMARALLDRDIREMVSTPIEGLRKEVANIRKFRSPERLYTVKSTQQFVNHARTALGKDFAAAEDALIVKLKDPIVDVTDSVTKIYSEIIEPNAVPLNTKGLIGREGRAKLAELGLDPEIASVYNKTVKALPRRAPGGEIPPEAPIHLSELRDVKRGIANRTSFSSSKTNAKDAVNAKLYGYFNEAIKNQPGVRPYYELSLQHHRGLVALDSVRDHFPKTKHPGKIISGFARDKTDDAITSLNASFDAASSKVRFSDSAKQQWYDLALKQQRSFVDGSIRSSRILSQIPPTRDIGKWRQTMLAMDADQLKSHAVTQLIAGLPRGPKGQVAPLKQFYDDLLKFREFEVALDVLSDAMNNTNRLVTAAAGAGMPGTAGKITAIRSMTQGMAARTAFKHPEFVQAVNKVNDVLHKLNAPSNPFIVRMFAGTVAPNRIASAIPVMLKSQGAARMKLKSVIEAARSYQASVNDELETSPGGGLPFVLRGPIQEGTPVPSPSAEPEEEFVEPPKSFTAVPRSPEENARLIRRLNPPYTPTPNPKE